MDRAFLGVSMHGRAEPGGVTLDQVFPDTPAARAGLKPGDRVVGLNGRPVRSPSDLTDRLDRTAAGEAVALDVVQNTSRRTVSVRTVSRPRPDAETKPKPAETASGRPKPTPSRPKPKSKEIAGRTDPERPPDADARDEKAGARNP